MNLDVLVLALASAPRPAGIAALYALLSASHPRRVLSAYIVAGLSFSVAVGVLVVTIFDGAEVDYGGTDVDSAIELLAGVAALGYAAGVGTGLRQPPSREEGAAERSAIVRRLRHPTPATAALAGVATHLPGLFYLVALNAIVAEDRGLVAGVFQVLLFNAIWFGAAIASVVVFLLRPGAARRALARVNGWARRHARGTTCVIFGAVGTYLAVKGVRGFVD
jgi:Sap, sulfolipid-1-addressing protein